MTGEIIGVGVAGRDERDATLFGVVKDSEGDWSGSLVVDEVGLKVVENPFDFKIGIEADVEAFFVEEAGDFFAENGFHLGDFIDLVWVERQLDTGETDDFEMMVGVFFDGEITGDTGGKDDDLVAALGEADS